jgi:hypothetical protein
MQQLNLPLETIDIAKAGIERMSFSDRNLIGGSLDVED